MERKRRFRRSKYSQHSVFNYDRFAEYLLSNRLYDLVLRREKLILGANEKLSDQARRPDALAEAAKIIASRNLATSQNNPVVYAALQRTLYLLRKRASSYVAVLKAISDIDARGLWLVVSVLARTAREQSGGIELLAGLLKELGKGRYSGGRRFPLIDSVYRVLRDEDYRLWLEELEDKSLKNAHLTVLYEHFVRAFEESDPTVWAAGVQYLFFLWKSISPHAYVDAKNITRLAGTHVGAAMGMAVSGRRRRIFRCLATLMLLVLSEAPADRFNDAVEEAGIVIRKLRIRKLNLVATLFVDTLPAAIRFADFLEQLVPNPVQMDSLTRYFAWIATRSGPSRKRYPELLDPDCDLVRDFIGRTKAFPGCDGSQLHRPDAADVRGVR